MPHSSQAHIDTPLANIEVTRMEITKELQNLNVSKSPGPDKLHPRVLREVADEISLPLHIIFEESFKSATIPQAWKDGHVVPIFKKGKKCEPGNYRPVSLTSIICKTIEKIVRKAVMGNMSRKKLFSNCQHGFLSGRSCTSNLLATIDKWTEALDESIPIDTIYLDFAKAFDTVPHQRLLTKL